MMGLPNYIRILILSVFIKSGFCNGDGDLYDVVIIGGGAAGITAAAQLEDHGITNIKILERADRIGGVLRSGQIGGYTVELGPGRVWDSDTEIKALVDQHVDLILYPHEKLGIYTDSGDDVTQEVENEIVQFDDITPAVNDFGQTLRDNNYPDMSVVNAYRMMGWEGDTPMRRVVNWLRFSVKDHPDIESLKYRAARKTGESYATNQDGFGLARAVAEYAMANIADLDSKLELSTVVTRVARRDDSVTVYTATDHFDARHVIVAYSMGELQHQSAIFEPPLPDWKLHAIHGYAATQYIKMHIRFPRDEPWFISDEVYRVCHVTAKSNYFMFWQNYEQFRSGSRVVMGIAKNEHAMEVRGMTDEEIKTEAVSVLRGMFGDGVPDAEEILVPRDDDDPVLYGSYSYWPTGYTTAQHEALKAAVGRVHFTGDYYMGNTESFMQADFTAGRQVADNVNSCRDNPSAKPEKCGEFQPSYSVRGCTYSKAVNFDPMARDDDGSCSFMDSDSALCLQASVMLMMMTLILSYMSSCM